MPLFELRPQDNVSELDDDPWLPWYDKTHGFIIRAATEQEARLLATKAGGDEVRDCRMAWLEEKYSSCTELNEEGESEVVMNDFARG